MRRKTVLSGLFGVLVVVSLLAFPGCATDPSQSPEAKQVATLVDEAVVLLASKGRDAFPELRTKDGKWYSGKTYIFVDDLKGIALLNPPSPELEGQNVIDMKDAKGKLLIREFINTAQTKGSGWVDYWWPKPGETAPSQKMSYIKKAVMPGGEEVLVGAGIYVE